MSLQTTCVQPLSWPRDPIQNNTRGHSQVGNAGQASLWRLKSMVCRSLWSHGAALGAGGLELQLSERWREQDFSGKPRGPQALSILNFGLRRASNPTTSGLFRGALNLGNFKPAVRDLL